MIYENLTNFRKVFVKCLTISQKRMNEIKQYTDDGKEQDEIEFESVIFADGMHMDVRCIPRHNGPSWCEAAIYREDVLSVPRERFLDIASKLDSLAFDDDPYEYHDNEGVESISDIADNLLNPTYRKAIIKALQDKQEYYAEDEFDDANIAERAKDILDNLAEIFGSDEQED